MGEHNLSRCKGCGAPLEGGGKKQKVKCPYCGMVNTFEKQTVSDTEIICPECGTANKKEFEHCVECGHNLYYACPKCGTRNEADAVHCAKCGTNLVEAAEKQKQDQLRKQEALEKKKKQQKKSLKFLFIYIASLTIIGIIVLISHTVKAHSPESQAIHATQTEAARTDPWLGVNWYASMNEDIARAMGVNESVEGMLVLQVYPGNPAEAAGLQIGTTLYQDPNLGEIPIGGDIITMVNGQPIYDVNYLWNLDYMESGDTITLTILRNGDTFEVPITLAKKPRWIDGQFYILQNLPFHWFNETGNFGIALFNTINKSLDKFKLEFHAINYTNSGSCPIDLSQITAVDDLGNIYTSVPSSEKTKDFGEYENSFLDLEFTPLLAENASILYVTFPETCGYTDIQIYVDLLSAELSVEYY